MLMIVHMGWDMQFQRIQEKQQFCIATGGNEVLSEQKMKSSIE